MSVLLRADSIAKSFDGRRVLSSATLRAVPGELRVLFGRNGIGKSTLLQIAAGVQQPDGGVVEFGGRARLRVTLPLLAREGLFLLPDRELLSPKVSVRRQLEFFRRQFDGADVEASAERMGIAARLDQLPPSLSGGELRRAELAAVLVRRPRCLLADEPYRGVAPADAELLTQTFRALAAAGCAVVVTGHEVPTLMAAADHVSWCTHGTTYELGPPSLAVAHEAFRRDYLGAWYRS
jgi:ABC-type multidrug transport system ATPase subunit